MKLENQVVSLDIAKRLKELGVPQESLFYYVNAPSNEPPHWHIYPAPTGNWKPEIYWTAQTCSAFTVAELGALLPMFVQTYKKNNGLHWHCSIMLDSGTKESFTKTTEADARGLMLIYLLENKLINL